MTTADGAEPHEFIAMRLPDSETRSFEEISALPPAEQGALFTGGFALWIIALPGSTDSAVRAGDGTLEPGRYTYFCSIDQGTTAEDVQGYLSSGEPPGTGTPHYAMGMSGWLVVE